MQCRQVSRVVPMVGVGVGVGVGAVGGVVLELSAFVLVATGVRCVLSLVSFSKGSLEGLNKTQCRKRHIQKDKMAVLGHRTSLISPCDNMSHHIYCASGHAASEVWSPSVPTRMNSRLNFKFQVQS